MVVTPSQIVSRLGQALVSTQSHWDLRDALVFAAGVGGDLERDSSFLLESQGPALAPTFATVAAGSWISDLSRTVYRGLPTVVAGFEYHVNGPLGVEGATRTTVVLAGIEVKRSVTVLWHDTETVDQGGVVLISGRHALLLRMTDGFETTGSIGRRVAKSEFIGAQELEMVERLTVDRRAIAQYRPILPLSANQEGPDLLHTDPTVAEAAGFPRPPLHAMAVIGHVGLAVSRAMGGLDANRVSGFGAQFQNPLFPGDQLVVGLRRSALRETTWLLEVSNGEGRSVLSEAWFELRH